MPTNLIALKTTEELMTGYVPVYQPIYPLFLAGKSVQYAAEVGNMNFRQMSAVGDIRQKRITPKDTEIKQINVTDSSKQFKKYFFANQFVISDLQDQAGAADVVAEVLDEHQIQMDELLMLGDGSSPATVINNGLYYSLDENYTLENSVAIASGSGRQADFYRNVMASISKADQVAGRKLIIFYGTDILPLFNSIYDTSARPWKTVLAEVAGPNYSFIQLPAASTPASSSGWIVVNIDQVKFHYTLLPELTNQGTNEEKMYYWFNFKMGSCMLEVVKKNAVIRQPATLAA